MTWLKTFLAALFGAVTNALLAWRDKRQAEAVMREAAVNDAALKTQDIITETADARSNLRPASDPGDLAHRLRERACDKAGSGGGDDR